MRNRATSAFTIIEVLVALTIAGIALLPVLAVMSRYLKLEAKNDRRRGAVELALSTAEEIQATRTVQDFTNEVQRNATKYCIRVQVLDGDRIDEPTDSTHPLEIHIMVYDQRQRLLAQLLFLKER